MYLLDTNICIYIINKRPLNIIEKFSSLSPDIIKLSSISIAELWYGVSKSQHYEKNKQALIDFISAFNVLEFDEESAKIYGNIRASLEEKGKIIGAYDMQIAAQAINYNLILVTNNINEFQRIGGLKVENWVL
jgi:tRNA(fMet)-specific endonuclease VapC